MRPDEGSLRRKGWLRWRVHPGWSRLPLGLALLLWSLGSVVLLGGVHRQSALGLAFSALVIGLLSWRRVSGRLAGVSLLLLACQGWTLLGAIPVPCALLQWLSPSSLDWWTRLPAPPGGNVAPVCHVSLAPSASVFESAKLGCYAILATLAAHHVRRSGLSGMLSGALAVGGVLAVTAIGHALVSAETLFGVYHPERSTPVAALTFLINPNNLAGALNLAVFCGLGLLLGRRVVRQRLLLTSGVAACFAAVILSGSRAGVAALLLGSVAVLSVGWRGGRRLRPTLAPVSAALLFGGALAVLSSTPKLVGELLADDVSKLGEFRALVSAFPAYWTLGIGRGAFESASAVLLGEPLYLVHRSVENFALSWLIEWGALFGGVALLALGWLLRPTRLGTARSARAAAVLTGVYCLLAQNLFDLGLDVPAIAGGLFVLVGGLEGAVWRQSAKSAGRTEIAPAPRTRSAWLLLMAAATISCLWASVSGPSLRIDRKDFLEKAQLQLALGRASSHDFERELRGEMTRWPLEPYFPLVAAQVALAQGNDALPLAAAALRRAPAMGLVHLTVADALAGRGARSQALIHLRQVLLSDPSLLPQVLRRATTFSTDLARLRRVAPTTEAGGVYLARLSETRALDLTQAERRTLLADALALAPGAKEVLVAEARRLIASGSPGGASQLRAIADRLSQSASCEGLQFRAQALRLEGRLAAALALLEECASCPAPQDCSTLRLDLSLASADPRAREEAEKAYYAAHCDGTESCARASDELGRRSLARRDPLQALAHFRDAATRLPTVERYRRIAQTALGVGQVVRARHAFLEFQRLGGVDDELAQALARAEQRGLQ